MYNLPKQVLECVLSEDWSNLSDIKTNTVQESLKKLPETLNHVDYGASPTGELLYFIGWSNRYVVVLMGDSFLGKYFKVIGKDPVDKTIVI